MSFPGGGGRRCAMAGAASNSIAAAKTETRKNPIELQNSGVLNHEPSPSSRVLALAAIAAVAIAAHHLLQSVSIFSASKSFGSRDVTPVAFSPLDGSSSRLISSSDLSA